MKSRLTFLLLLLVLVSVPVFAQAPAPLYNPQTMATLGDEIFRGSGATGMVLVIVHDNQVFFHGYGETAPGSHQLPTQDSVLRICSLTKIFTADLLTKLVAGKTVKLTDPLQSFAGIRSVPKKKAP